MAERGHCRRRKIAAAATLLMPGKAARGLVQLHKLCGHGTNWQGYNVDCSGSRFSRGETRHVSLD